MRYRETDKVTPDRSQEKERTRDEAFVSRKGVFYALRLGVGQGKAEKLGGVSRGSRGCLYALDMRKGVYD